MTSIVSDLVRSGTSPMMQMLVDNPGGCLRWERIQQLPRNAARIAEAEGEAVKLISRRLPAVLAIREKRSKRTHSCRDSKLYGQSRRVSYREVLGNLNKASEKLDTPLSLKAIGAQLEASLDRNPAG
jgi:hypothetical protein